MNGMCMIASVVRCIVGCNAGSPDAQALHVMECDAETGEAPTLEEFRAALPVIQWSFAGE